MQCANNGSRCEFRAIAISWEGVNFLHGWGKIDLVLSNFGIIIMT